MEKINKNEIYLKILNGELNSEQDWISLSIHFDICENILNEFASKFNWRTILLIKNCSLDCFIKNYEYIKRDCNNDYTCFAFFIKNTKPPINFIKKYIFPITSKTYHKKLQKLLLKGVSCL